MPRIGNGCIFENKKRPGHWFVEITTGYDYRGKRKRVRRSASGKTEAIALHRKMIAELVGGSLGDPKTEAFQSYADWWLSNVKAIRVRSSTLSDYRYRLIRNIYPHFGHRRIGEITARDIEDWLAMLARRGMARASINGSKQVLGAVLDHAYRQGVISRNPSSLVTRLPQRADEVTQVKEPWSKDEAMRALQDSYGTRVDLFVHLGVIYGLRRGEILGLKWEDLDFANGVLHVRRTLKEERTLSADGSSLVSLTTSEPKTKSSRRRLHLAPAVMSSIQRHRDYVQNLRAKAGHRWVESGFVFQSPTGGPVHPSNMAQLFKSFLKNRGIRLIRVHDMRHTAAVLGLEAGVRLEAVSQGLGHSRIDITKSVYAPYVQPLMVEFTSGLSAYLGSGDSFNAVEEVMLP
jgi:integrase